MVPIRKRSKRLCSYHAAADPSGWTCELRQAGSCRYSEDAMLPIGPYTLKNRFILAPMAGVSEMPFRVIAFEQGAALAPTELISAQGLFRINSRTLRYLRYDAKTEKPYSLQL